MNDKTYVDLDTPEGRELWNQAIPCNRSIEEDGRSVVFADTQERRDEMLRFIKSPEHAEYQRRSKVAHSMLHTAQLLRDSGIYIFERRCYEDQTWESDGKKYRSINGCWSYFRYLFGLPIICPFCGRQWPYPAVRYGGNLVPLSFHLFSQLTANVNGSRYCLTDEEQELAARFISPQEVTE